MRRPNVVDEPRVAELREKALAVAKALRKGLSRASSADEIVSALTKAGGDVGGIVAAGRERSLPPGWRSSHPGGWELVELLGSVGVSGRCARVRCGCGVEAIRTVSALRLGRSRSCKACKGRGCPGANPRLVVGWKACEGGWQIVELLGARRLANGGSARFARVRCGCGFEREISFSRLAPRNGKPGSCRCRSCSMRLVGQRNRIHANAAEAHRTRRAARKAAGNCLRCGEPLVKLSARSKTSCAGCCEVARVKREARKEGRAA